MNGPSVPEAVLDDTILDGRSGLEPALRAISREAAARIAGVEAETVYEDIVRVYGGVCSNDGPHRERRLMNPHSVDAEIIQGGLASLGFDKPSLASELAVSYRALRESARRPFPGAVETLQRFRSRGIRIGLVTNGRSDMQRAKIERSNLENHFDYVLIEGEFGSGKPDEAVFLAAMIALGSSPQSTWMVGDSLEFDIAPARALGPYTVWVTPANSQLPAVSKVRPDRIVSSISELY